jgi:AAA+ ATPase superfamily predicted ATPase
MADFPIVDRKRELTELRRLAAAPPALVVLRGRRRVGKSHLLRAAFSGGRLVSFQADEQSESGHLRLLAGEAARLLPGSPPLAFATWPDALAFFAAQAAQGPLTVVLDEFQYLCRAQPALPSFVQRAWDEWQRSRVPILLVLSGSAISFMEGLLGQGAPLYGRADYRPLLLPLDYDAAAEFAPAGAPADALVERYAVLGGTPQYQVWAGGRAVPAIIRETALAKGAPLYEEPLNLLRAEEGIRDPGTYFAALLAIAQGQTGTGQIASRAQVAPSVATRMLDRLRDLGYVEQRVPVDLKQERARAYWRIGDPYFRFWFRYVFPNRSRLERELVDDVAGEVLADLSTFVGHVFEDCCRDWVGRRSPVAGESIEVGAWWSRKGDAEIDVVAVGKDRHLLLGSCKWRERDVGESMLDQLYEHRALLGPKAARARLALFARSGFSPAVRARAQREDVLLVTAADLFADGRPGAAATPRAPSAARARAAPRGRRSRPRDGA